MRFGSTACSPAMPISAADSSSGGWRLRGGDGACARLPRSGDAASVEFAPTGTPASSAMPMGGSWNREVIGRILQGRSAGIAVDGAPRTRLAALPLQGVMTTAGRCGGPFPGGREARRRGSLVGLPETARVKHLRN